MGVVVGVGFLCAQGRRATRLRYAPTVAFLILQELSGCLYCSGHQGLDFTSTPRFPYTHYHRYALHYIRAPLRYHGRRPFCPVRTSAPGKEIAMKRALSTAILSFSLLFAGACKSKPDDQQAIRTG